MQVDQSYTGEEIYDYVSQFKDGNIEVEYKIKIGVKLFIELLNSFRGQKPLLEQTTNAIYEINTGVKGERNNFIISKNYSTNTINKYTKRRLLDGNCDDFSNINVSASVEKPFTTSAKPSGVDKVNIYRIKNRISFVCGEWRYDFTQTAQHSPGDRFFNENTVKISAQSMFGKLDQLRDDELINGYIESCGNTMVQSFELEVELIAPLNVEHFTTHSFLNCLGNNRKIVKEKLYYNVVISGLDEKLTGQRKTGQNADHLSLKRLLNNAVTLTKTMYNNIFPPIGWFLSRKADGERAVLMVMKSGTVYLLTDKVTQLNNFGRETDIEYSHSFVGGHYDEFNPVTILECEFIKDKKKNKLLVWDCIYVNDKSIIDKRFADRYPIAAACCEQFTDLPIDILPKELDVITEDIHTSVKRALERKPNFPEDGFILTEPDKNYYNTRCLKIKTNNTIDFLVIELPDRLSIKVDNNNGPVFLLFCSISPQTMETMKINHLPYYTKLFNMKMFRGRIPVHFCPPDNPYAYIWYPSKDEVKQIRDTVAKQDPTRPWVIAELNYIESHWVLERIRHDRYNEPNYYGNDFTNVALHNWEAIQNPVRVEELHMAVTNYFKTGKNEYYHAQTTAMSFVKYRIFDLLFSHGKSTKDDIRVIDFAVGKGQDLNKYVHHGVTKLLGIDVDRVALSELLTRYYDMINKRGNNTNMSLTIMQQDLTDKHSSIFEQISKIWLNSTEIVYPQYLICNLAMHYFIRNVNELTNFASLLKSLMANGSLFMYTTFNGRQVFDLLTANDGDWVAHVEGSVKYRIIKKYVNEQFGDFGQTIAVKLPFTNDDLYEENLVNVENVNFAFGQMGLKVVAQGSFADFFDLLKVEQNPVWKKLNDEDKKFIGLYQYTILRA